MLARMRNFIHGFSGPSKSDLGHTVVLAKQELCSMATLAGDPLDRLKAFGKSSVCSSAG